MKTLILFIAMVILFIPVLGSANTPFIQMKHVATSQIPDDLLIPDLGSVVVDDNGNVFAFAGKHNGSECFVIKWDKDLRFVKRFLQFGSGPAEATMNQSSPYDRLSLDPFNGDVVIQDINPVKIIIFDNNGIYKKDINPLRISNSLGYMDNMKSLGNGNYFVFKPILHTWNTECILATLDPLQEKVLYRFLDKPLIAKGNQMTIQYNTNDYCGSRNFVDIDGQYLVVANSQFYHFMVFDCLGNKKLEIVDKNKKLGKFTAPEMAFIIQREFTQGDDRTSAHNQQVAILTQEKKAFNVLLDLIENNKNPLQNILIGGNRIYLFLVNDDITVPGKIPTVIYDLKGNIVKKAIFTKVPNKIWKQYAYFIELDSDDNPFIKKYQILD